MSIEEYRRFIASRGHEVKKSGFDPSPYPETVKTHQAATLDFALNRGKSAAFLDTGLGKSFIELEFARQCADETGKPSLILTPLAVAGQMVREGNKFNIDARQIREQSEVGRGVMVANYERLPKLDPTCFGAVILDESSILKSFGGRTVTALIEAFERTNYKLAATATPSPNDYVELGQHSHFLDVMTQSDMLTRWFIKTQDKTQNWRLKGHAEKDFWRWVASLARCATLPSDLGGDDAGYVLSPIDRRLHKVSADISFDTDGLLFRVPEMSATSFHKEKVRTLKERCDLAADLANTSEQVTVWCERNDESEYLASAIDDAKELRGDMTPEQKEKLILDFQDGKYRTIISKPKLAGFGVNWQHCNHAVFASISFSYEQHYQAVRRSQRFGQTKRVRNDIVISDTEEVVWNTIQRKMRDHDKMKEAMREAMREAQNISGLRVSYGDRDKVSFPSWLKGE